MKFRDSNLGSGRLRRMIVGKPIRAATLLPSSSVPLQLKYKDIKLQAFCNQNQVVEFYILIFNKLILIS